MHIYSDMVIRCYKIPPPNRPEALGKELLLVQNLTDLFTKDLIEYQSQRLGDWK